MYHYLVLLIRPRLQQEPHHLEVALVAGQGQGGLLELVAVGVDAGSELKENPAMTNLSFDEKRSWG